MIRYLLGVGVTVALLSFGLVAQARAADAPDIAGEYKCEGTGSAGGTYSGTVQIAKKGETYEISWTLNSGETYKGLGILQGDVLAVTFSGGNGSGVVAYKVDKGGKLSGKWSLPEANGKVYTETLTK